MMSFVFAALLFVSVVFGVLGGNIAAVTAAAIGEPANAVALVLKLAGGLCLWSGIAEIASESGLTDRLCEFCAPLTRRLFKGIDPKGPAMSAIAMNMIANFLGLGNAATPLGIKAISELEKEEKSGEDASDNAVLFVILNTASLQLIPTTVLMLRGAHNSAAPAEIISAVWLTSVACACVGVCAAKIISKRGRKKHGCRR